MKYENKTLKELQSLLRGAELMTDTKSIEEIKWHIWLLK